MERVLVCILCEVLHSGVKELANRVLEKIGSVPFLITSEKDEPVETRFYGFPILPLHTNSTGGRWRSFAFGKVYFLAQTLGKEWVMLIVPGKTSAGNEVLLERIDEFSNVQDAVAEMKKQSKKAVLRQTETGIDERVSVMSAAFLNHSYPTVPQMAPRGKTPPKSFSQVWKTNVDRLGVQKLVLSSLPVPEEVPADVEISSALYQDVERLGDDPVETTKEEET